MPYRASARRVGVLLISLAGAAVGSLAAPLGTSGLEGRVIRLEDSKNGEPREFPFGPTRRSSPC